MNIDFEDQNNEVEYGKSQIHMQHIFPPVGFVIGAIHARHIK